MWHEIFTGSNFGDFGDFPAIRKKEVPANKNYRKQFSRKNLLQTKKSGLLNYKMMSLSFRNKAVYNEIWFTVLLFENMYLCCKYSIKTKLWLLCGRLS